MQIFRRNIALIPQCIKIFKPNFQNLYGRGLSTKLPNFVKFCLSNFEVRLIWTQKSKIANSPAVKYKNFGFPLFSYWSPNSPDLNPPEYYVWGAMLAEYEKYQPKPKTTTELKTVLMTIWDNLPQQSINKAFVSLYKTMLKHFNKWLFSEPIIK